MRNFWCGIVLALALFISKSRAQNIHEITVTFPSVPECITLEANMQAWVYPNPTSRFIHIPKGALPILYDVSGKRVKVSMHNLNQMDLEGLKPGIYQLHLLIGANRSTVKIVKL